MILKDVIEVLEKAYPDYKCINIYYHADLQGNNGEKFPSEFVGVSSYHDNYLDDSEDPDGWSLEDEVRSYKIIDYVNGILSIDIDLGEW